MYGCESWTIKKAEHQRISDFDLWCWRRLFPLDCKENKWVNSKGNQSWILEGLMLKLKLQYFGHLIWKGGKDPDVGKDWRQEEKGATEDGMVGCITDLMDMSLSKLWGLVMCTVPGVAKLDTTEQLNWTELIESNSVHIHHMNMFPTCSNKNFTIIQAPRSQDLINAHHTEQYRAFSRIVLPL